MDANVSICVHFSSRRARGKRNLFPDSARSISNFSTSVNESFHSIIHPRLYLIT